MTNKRKAKKPLHLVIGAGPGGILCAHELSKHGNILLFETGTIRQSEMSNTEPKEWAPLLPQGSTRSIKKQFLKKDYFHERFYIHVVQVLEDPPISMQ
jgi:flavin-dependent dehydrogenase